MTPDGLLTLAVAARERHPVASVVAVLALMAAIQLGLMLLAWCVLRRDRGDDDPGSDGGGGSRRRPPKPPPQGPVDWREFERRFADHVRARSPTAAGGRAGHDAAVPPIERGDGVVAFADR